MKKDQKHPEPRQLLQLVEGKMGPVAAGRMQLHALACRKCAEILGRVCVAVEQRTEVEIDIQIGKVLQQFNEVYDRIKKYRAVMNQGLKKKVARP